MEAHDRSEAWKSDTICDACHRKSNHKQNELIAEKAGHGKKSNGRLAEIEALLKALEECERTGYTLSDEELEQLNAKLAELGIA